MMQLRRRKRIDTSLRASGAPAATPSTKRPSRNINSNTGFLESQNVDKTGFEIGDRESERGSHDIKGIMISSEEEIDASESGSSESATRRPKSSRECRPNHSDSKDLEGHRTGSLEASKCTNCRKPEFGMKEWSTDPFESAMKDTSGRDSGVNFLIDGAMEVGTKGFARTHHAQKYSLMNLGALNPTLTDQNYLTQEKHDEDERTCAEERENGGNVTKFISGSLDGNEFDLREILRSNEKTLKLRGFLNYEDALRRKLNEKRNKFATGKQSRDKYHSRKERRRRMRSAAHCDEGDGDKAVCSGEESWNFSGADGDRDKEEDKFMYSTSDSESVVDENEDVMDFSVMDVKREWRRSCKRIDPALVISDRDSRMEGQHMSPRKPGEPGYAALPITEENNCDLKSIYDVRFACSISRGHPITAYPNLKSTLGQFARLCVCLKIVELKELWKPGKLFSQLLNKLVIDVFITYFRIRARPTTISNKAANLKRAVDHAALFYARDENMKARAEEMRVLLHQVRSVERREVRRSSKGILEDREAAGKMMSEYDMEQFAEKSYQDALGVLRTAREFPAPTDLFRKPRTGIMLINKWCVNLTVLLMMTGNGQRPQVYRQLIVPAPELINSWGKAGMEVSLRTFLEKTPRNMECPGVLFPQKTAKLLRFHVKVVRPFILEMLSLEEPGGMDEIPLLLNTRTGGMLSASDLRGTLRCFLVKQDPELGGITPMVLRSSFASLMFTRYKRGLVGKGQPVEHFLADLAKLMNTSAEMLTTTYIASNPQDFPGTVLILFKAFQRLEQREQDQADEE
jgi:hypothetical protein